MLRLQGCRQNNLKNLTLDIPKHSIIVITGVSGSGKSSLAFDTIYAEGQRRYLEYLSPEIRRWIKQLPKPNLDFIEGLSPTLAVGQHRSSLHYKSTVATHTDIYDFLSILFASIGEQHSPETGKRLTRYTRQQMVEAVIQDYPENSKLQLIAPVRLIEETIDEAIKRLQKLGFIRILLNGKEIELDSPLLDTDGSLEVVVDRLIIKDGIRDRLAGSIETALGLNRGILKVHEGSQNSARFYTEVYLCPESGLSFTPLEPRDFNFSSPYGACPVCKGNGEHCEACHGARIKPESRACLIDGKNIHDYCSMTVDNLLKTIENWDFQGTVGLIANEILPDLLSRLRFLQEVGLGYLELTRSAPILSEGEQQRLQLASQIGSKLSGILYVLDEPSRGLHHQDLVHLKKVLLQLKNLGNTVLIVEHEKEIIALADQVIEIGPGAGIHGGKITYQGSYKDLKGHAHTVSGPWLSGKDTIPIPLKRRKSHQTLSIHGVTSHNLVNFSLDIPLGVLVGLCGVSGSGKSTLAIDLLSIEMQKILRGLPPSIAIKGTESIQRLVVINQEAAGVSSRSIPATYIDVMTPLRNLFAETKLAKSRGYTAARFGLNRKGGRCEACEGQGLQRIDLQLMPDLMIPCELCRGKRYNYETLQITWDNYTIADILDMSSEKAYGIFQNVPGIGDKLLLMQELGLDYLSLGQHATTLSGGELQRLKLVADLVTRSPVPTLYIMDEPSAGLHFQDVKKLVKILHRLVEAGHSVVIVEHNLDLLMQADWLIELGPGAGPHGGKVVFEGVPEKLKKQKTPTGVALN